MRVNVCVEGAIFGGARGCALCIFVLFYMVLYTQDESTWVTTSSRLQMVEMALLAWVGGVACSLTVKKRGLSSRGVVVFVQF